MKKYFYNTARLMLCQISMFLLAFGFAVPTYAQSQDSKGTDFWLMFNGNISTPTLTLFITSDVNTSGTVSVPGLAFSVPFNVVANSVTPVVIPTAVATHTSNVIDNKGIRVTSLQEVTVYGLNYAPFTTDAYLGLPTDVLGKDYIVLSYTGNTLSSFGIVGTVNGTTVTIIPSVSTSGRVAGVPYNIVINQGQTYELGNASDLTGSIITSTQPIGVTGANACANIPPGFGFCDHINEMLPPTTTWGKKFGTVPLSSRINGDTWRFLASENATVVTINGVAQAPINRGQFLERVLTVQSVVESNKPILAAQYANGSGFSGNPGDPFMMLIPPLEQFLAKYTVTTVSGYVAHFINLIAPNAIVGTLTLDGAAVPAGSFTPIGATGFSGARISVTPGTHNLFGTLPFGVFMYGFNTDDSYGYPGGQSFGAVATVATVSSITTPPSGTSPVGISNCFSATVRDQFSNPVPGVRVDFTITGTNPGSTGFAFTDASGVATFCYSGPTPGPDQIVASVGSINSGPANFLWTPPVISNVYYSKAAGDLHNVLTWGVNPDGSGANPPDFGVGKTFNLVNRGGTFNMTANWSVEGTLVNPTGSQLFINGFALSLADIVGTGTLSGSFTSNLNIIGSAGGDIQLRFTAASNTLNEFNLNRTGALATATLATALNVAGVLTLTSGTFNTSNLLTLKSSAANTARVAPIIAASIVGDVTVERFIPARRAWRLLAAPVDGAQSINAAWQEGVTSASPVPNPNPGFGTHITQGGAPAGLDFNTAAGATGSLKRYNNATNTWNTVTNTATPAVNSDAWFIFVRGDRGISLSFNNVPANNTTLRSKGPLKVGDQNYPVFPANLTPVANPYASPINFATITRTNVNNSFWLVDPKMGTTGAFVTLTYNPVTMVYDIAPATFVSPNSQYIQSGQGFLVSSAGGGASSITIKESDKSATPAANVFRQNNAGMKSVRINLQCVGEDNTDVLLDGVLATYNSAFSRKVDEMDAVKAENPFENLAIVTAGEALMVERRDVVKLGDVIQLKMWNLEAGAYSFDISTINLAGEGMPVYLVDNYLKTSTALSLETNTTVAFTISSDVASRNAERFSVVFGKVNLPYVNPGKDGFTVYPNPVTEQRFNIQFADKPAGTYQVQIVDQSGRAVMVQTVKHVGGNFTYSMDLGKRHGKGLYQVKISNGKEVSVIPAIMFH